MKLSVVIPVLNSQSTLRRCVESVMGQSVADMEVILVDDGSDSACARLCDDLGKADSKIVVIHKDHGGLSSARNAGIAASRGEYITFVDSDDTLAPQTYARLMTIVDQHTDYDLLEYPMMEHYGDNKREHLLTFEPREWRDMQDYWLSTCAYSHSYACNKVFRQGLFDGVKFPEGKNFEDLPTLFEVLKRCKVVATTGEGMYYYWRNEQGITSTASAGDYAFLLETNNRILRSWHDAAYYAHVVNIALTYHGMSGIIPDVVNLPYHNTFKLKLKRLIGLKNLCRLHRTCRSSRS